MSIKNNLLQQGVKFAAGTLKPYLGAFQDPELMKSLLEAKNLSLPEGETPPQVPAQTIQNIENYQNAIDPDVEAFFNALNDVRAIIDSIRTVAEAHHADGGWGTADELSRQILNELTLNALRFKLPAIFHVMRALRFIEDKLDDQYTNELFWHRVGAFFEDVGGYFKDTFGELQTEEDAREIGHTLFIPAAALLGLIKGEDGFLAQYHWDASPDSATPRIDTIADRTFTALVPFENIVGGGGQPGGGATTDLDAALIASLTFVPREHGGPGVLLSIGGESELVFPFTIPLDNDADTNGAGTPDSAESTKLVLRVEQTSPSVGSLFIPFDGDTTFPTFPDALQGIELAATLEPEGEFQNRLLGSKDGTRLELGKPKVSLKFKKLPDATGITFDANVVAKQSAIVLKPPKLDGFLKHILPSGDLRVQMDLGVGVKKKPGGKWDAYLVGGDTLEVTLPGGKKLGPTEIKQLTSKLKPSSGGGSSSGQSRTAHLRALASGAEPGGIEFEQTAAVTARIGPVTATVDRIGFQLRIREAEDGNLGLYDVDVGFRAPDGVGIAIDAGSVYGGGYLFFDRAEGRYAGVVQLQLEKIALSAIGLLDTRMPDGSSGFSLLLMVTAEDFAPINLGLGFKLTGIGGLLGINRSVAVDVLRTGLKNRTLDAVLFPEDPVRNAVSIVRTVGRVFPATPGQYVIGPVAEVSWGLGELFTAQLGLVLEFPNPLRIVLLGQLKARFPTKEKPLVQLNLDLFGVIDFNRGEALVLATLFDSKLVGWSVTGDAAFYARWKNDPEFILSAGGFHPAFPAPSQLPALDRLVMNLSQSDNVRLRLTWYLALTSNTLQHGALLELHISAAGFSVDGHLGYDTLIQFDPFGFMISFTAGVGLKWHGHTLASVQLDGSLAGPSPWHVKGKATFKIWRFSKSVDFDKTIGEKEPLPPLPVVDPLPPLVAALSAPASWDAALPAQEEQLVTLRAAQEPGQVLVHPLGSVAVRQQVLPLNQTIGKFGNARVTRERSYHITAVEIGSTVTTDVMPLNAHFAPGQFQELTQAQRLARRSFEDMQAGVQVAPNAITYGGRANTAQTQPAHRRDVALSYETVVLGETAQQAGAGTSTESSTPGAQQARTAAPAESFTPAAQQTRQQAGYGAAAKCAVRRGGAARFRNPRPRITRALSVQEAKEMVPA